MGFWLEILLLVVLVGLNAFLAGSEMAFVSLRPSQLSNIENRGKSGRRAVAMFGDPSRMLSTVQVGITFAGFFASATAAISIAEPLVPQLGALGEYAEAVAVVTITVVLSIVMLIFGELVPKRIAMQRAEGWAIRSARTLDALSAITRPLVWLLATCTNVVVRMLGGDPTRKAEAISAEELKYIVATQESLTDLQRTIVSGALEVSGRKLRNVLVPRNEVLFFKSEMSVEDARQALVEHGHTRAPVLSDQLDDVLGLVHLSDLVNATGTVDEHLREVLVLPESALVLSSLRQLQDARAQLAMVLDEFGVIEGIVTMEDLLEEIVGEIYDELDKDFQTVQRTDSGVITVPGRFPSHDLAEIGVRIPIGEHATVAGIVVERLGRIAKTGDQVEIGPWTAEVVAARRNAITRVRLSPSGEDQSDETGVSGEVFGGGPEREAVANPGISEA